MFDLLPDLSSAWLNGAVRVLEGLRRGLTSPFPVYEDPSPTTPSEVIYEGGKW